MPTVAFLLALACAGLLFGGVLGASRWRRRRAERYLGGDAVDGFALSTMSTRSFESVIVDAFRLKGYHPTTTARGNAGELVLRRDHETCVVDCRRWRDEKVGARAIEALQGAMRSRGASSGFAITRGRFSRAATAAARAANIRLIEGRALKGLIEPLGSPPRGEAR